MLVKWTTDSNATRAGLLRRDAGARQRVDARPDAAALSHAVSLTGLTPGQTYYYDVESQDLIGNTTRDDNGGQHYRSPSSRPGDLLLVYDGEASRAARPLRQRAASRSAGSIDVWSGPLAELRGSATCQRPALLPGGVVADRLRATTRRSPTPRATRSRQYLAGGGRLAVDGHDIAWGIGDARTSPYYTAARAAWVQSHAAHAVRRRPADDGAAVSGVAARSDLGRLHRRRSLHGTSRGRLRRRGDLASPGAGAATYDWISGDATPANRRLPLGEHAAPLGTPGSGVWGGATVAARDDVLRVERDRRRASTGLARPAATMLEKTLTWLIGRDKPTVAVTRAQRRRGDHRGPASQLSGPRAPDGGTVDRRAHARLLARQRPVVDR